MAKVRKVPSTRWEVFVEGAFTSIRNFFKKNDLDRWAVVENIHPAWEGRTEQMAKLIPANFSVLEFGAGRMVLRKWLPPGCIYTPSDLVDRGEGTIVCDLNFGNLPTFNTHDIAVFSGVLEYVNDIPQLAIHLSKSVCSILASYATLERNGSDRRAMGWVNDFSEKEFIDFFSAAGFDCTHKEDWMTQRIFLFKKREIQVPSYC